MSLAALSALSAPPLASATVETLVLRSQAFPMKPYQVVQGVTAVPSPRVDGYVVGMTVEVVDSAGRIQTMDDVMLHHAVFVKALVPDYTCGRFYDYDRRPSPLPAERFFGAGEEHMELRLPQGYGYPNRGSDIWGLVYMLMNHRNAAATVHVQYRVQYVTGEPRTPVKPVWLDVRSHVRLHDAGERTPGLRRRPHPRWRSATRAPQRDLREPRALNLATELALALPTADDARARP